MGKAVNVMFYHDENTTLEVTKLRKRKTLHDKELNYVDMLTLLSRHRVRRGQVDPFDFVVNGDFITEHVSYFPHNAHNHEVMTKDEQYKIEVQGIVINKANFLPVEGLE